MNKFVVLVVILISSLFSCDKSKTRLAPQQEVIDEYFGEKIIDPYRNLENMEDSTVLSWFRYQEKNTEKVLNTIPGRDNLLKTILDNNQKTTYRIKRSFLTDQGHYFYIKKYNNDTIAKMYYKSSYDDPEEHLIFDPTTFKDNDATNYTISYIKPSPDTNKLLIGMTKKGEEVSKIIVLNIETGALFPQVITQVDPGIGDGIQWLKDSSGFTYHYLPIINVKSKQFYLDTATVLYKLGENPNERNIIFSKSNNPDLDIKEEDFPVVHILPQNDTFIFGSISGVNKYKDTYYGSMKDVINGEKISWKSLFTKEDKVKKFTIHNDDLIFLSAKGASNFQICKTSISDPNFNTPEILVKEKENSIILDLEYKDNTLFFTTLRNGIASKFYCVKDTIEKEIQLPAVSGKSNLSLKGEHLYISVTGWTTQYTLYHYDQEKNLFKKANLTPKKNYTEFEDIVVNEIEVPSHDGVMVPLSIIHKKNMSRNGKNNTFLMGYGSYGSPSAPYFSPTLLTWVSEGGILAVAHVRGGGEKGDAWHRAGFKTTKPNTWKDAIACTEYLIKEKYTSANHTTIFGLSAGGIMVARAITERPDLYRVAIGMVPAINMMRSEFEINGANNIKEFGTVKDSIEFKALLEMDAYHHIKKNQEYPATLITAGMKDQRVVAWDPAKFVAKLQYANQGKNPILFKVDFNEGHRINSSREKAYEELADIFSFALWQTGHPDYQPKN